VFRLVDIMKSAGEVDWALAGLVCQLIWNYTEEMTSTTEYFLDVDADDLMTTLTDFIGEVLNKQTFIYVRIS